jgi:hypothetical protein
LHSLNSGEILALMGLVLLLVNKGLRGQMLKSRQTARGLRHFWLQWGDLAIFLVILAGLTLMWSQK